MTSNQCHTCKFFVARAADAPGNCRRYPPTMLYQPVPLQTIVGKPPEISWEHQASNFPLVRKDWWCGEYMTQLAIAVSH